MFNNVINTYTDILTSVRRFHPTAVLAGGCLRDTFYGVEVKDLDFILEAPPGAAPFPVTPESQWIREIWPDKQWQWAAAAEVDYDMGEENPGGLIDVVKDTEDTINFIIVSSIPQYTHQFPDSISKLVFDGERVHYANEWMVGHNTSTVFYRPNIGNVRLEKLQRKYPNWVFQRDRVEEEVQQQEVFPFPGFVEVLEG